MIHLNKKTYPYMEEVNDGILRQFRRLLPVTGRVLDVGCGRAALGEAVGALGWEVWGVEQSAEACATAGRRLHRLVEADLHDTDRVAAGLGETRFDGLIFSDVLEHVYDPRGTLEKYLEYVKPGGRVFISVPNAVVWTNRLRLMCGRVEYADTGVMDRTHIRFFTFRTARRLAEAAGCRVERVDSTPYLARALLPLLKRRAKAGGDAPPDPRALIDSRPYRMYEKYFYPVERAAASLWRTMLAFRIIVVAVKADQGEDFSVMSIELNRDNLTVAMITRNEEKAIAKVIGDVRRAVPEAEILVVDSSSDRTAEIARELGARVIQQFPPRGYGPAMDTALRSAAGRVVVTLDCDDTYPAEAIPTLARMVLEEGYDVVDGSRLRSKPAAMPWPNYLANFAFALAASLLFWRRVTDLHSGMRAYRKELIDALTYEVNGAALPVELLLRPIKMGKRLKVVYIEYRERIGQTTMRPLQSAWWTLRRILSVRFS